MQGSLYIVDALNYLYRAFFALPPLRTATGMPTGALYGLCQMLLRIEREHQPSHLVVVFDAPGKTFRDEMYADYKAQRPPMPPELVEQVGRVPRVIQAFGIATLTIDGVEADDVIATLTTLARAQGVQVVICSSDKDLLQLVGEGVSVLDAVKNRLLGRTEVVEKWGVPPERVADLLALTGDSVDNVPGVPGIGPKTAAELLKTHGSLDGLLAHADAVKGKRGEALRANVEAVRLARRLVTLKEDVPLPQPLNALARTPPDRGALVALFREFEFGRLLAREEAAFTGTAAAPPPAPAAATPPAHTGTLDLFGRAPSPAAAPAPPAPVPAVIPPPASAPSVFSSVADLPAVQALVTQLSAAPRFGLAYQLDVLDPLRASLTGLAFAWPGADLGAPVFVPVAGQGVGQGQLLEPANLGLPEAEVLRVLAPLFADARVEKCLFDEKPLEIWLGQRGAALGGVTADLRLMAFLLDPSRTHDEPDEIAAAHGQAAGAANEPRARAARHAALALALAPALAAKLEAAALTPLYRDLELPLAHVLARVERHGVRIDAAVLKQMSQEAGSAAQALEHEIHALAGKVFNIGSPKQLGAVLFETLGLPVIRKNKTGPSTDADVLDELAALHPVPAKILEYRTLTKLKNTYLDALPSLINPRTGRLHTTFRQTIAATGRLSSSDPNLQNIPIRNEWGGRIRKAFVADAGQLIVSADYSQIELRVLAHFSGDPAFLAAFTEGADVHQRTAAEVFGIAAALVTPDQRRIAKAINFGLVFGQTDFGLSRALGIPRAEAKTYIENYFRRYAGVRAYMEKSIADAHASGESTTLLGRRRAIAELQSPRAAIRAQGERMARNTPIQGSAADLLKLAMIRVDAGLPAWTGARMILTVHDELVFEVPADDAPRFGAWVKHEMESVHALRVPLVVDVGWGPSWGAAH